LRIDTSAALQALQMALEGVDKAEDLIHHSDRGIQYCSHSYVRLLRKHEIAVSMTQTGSPYDNAIAERVNGIIKHELIFPFGQIQDLQQAKTRVQEAVTKYNHLRLHQSLKYKTPNIVHSECKP
jgi:transposase InsO family protein